MKKIFYSVAVLAGIFFVYLACNFEKPIWITFDTNMRTLLKDNAFIIVFHYLGEPVVAAITGIVLILYLAIREKDYRAMLFVVLTFAAGNGLNQLLKHLVQRQRPELVDQLTSYSFPSGHTMAGLFTVVTVTYFLTRGSKAAKNSIIWFVAITLVLLVGLSRIAEGRHFATDVLAGWCIGYTWFMGCLWWYERRKNYFKRQV